MQDGLSQSFVYSFEEDNQGFIWIATQDGLNRFDGENFTHYKNDINNPNSVADNFIRKIFVDNENTLWVGTSKGLSRYNREYDNFDNFYHVEGNHDTLSDDEIWDIYQDNEGTLWISTQSNLHKYIANENRFQKVRIRGFERDVLDVKTIYQDLKGNYWFGTFDNGIYVSNSALSFTYALKDKSNNKIFLDVDSLFDIVYFKEQYWLATEKGLYTLDENQKQLSRVELTANSNEQFDVRSIEVFDENHLMIGTFNGLFVFDVNTYESRQNVYSDTRSSLLNNRIFAILKSSTGQTYIGTHTGLNIYNPFTSLFDHIPTENVANNRLVESIAETSNGDIWFSSTTNALYRLDDDKAISTNITFDEHVGLLRSSPEQLLFVLTTDGKLHSVNQNNQVRGIANINIDLYESTKTLAVESDSHVWFIDTKGRLNELNTQTGSKRIASEDLTFSALAIHKGVIWLLAADDIYQYEIETQTFNHLSEIPEALPYIAIGDTIHVSGNYIWVTTLSNGFIAIDKNTKQTIIINSQLGLLNDSINSLKVDANENAWVTTTQGVSAIDVKQPRIQNFYTDFKLESNEPVYGSSIYSTNGQFYYGGIDGIHTVDVELALNQKKQITKPILTNLRILNKSVTASPHVQNSILKYQLSETESFTLDYKDSPFTIEFVSPNAALPEQLVYRYKLEGLDSAWIETERNNKRATYTNLSAGLYVFEVEAFDKYDPGNRQNTSVKINVLPPLWLSNGAIFIYLALTLAIIGYFIQQAKYKRQYNLQIKKSEERLKLSLWGSGDEMWDWNISTGKIYRSNIWGILEFPQDGRRNLGTDQTNIHPQDIPRVREALNKHFEDDTTHFEATYRVKGKDEKWMWILDRGKIVERDKSNEPTRMTGTLKDISHIKTAEERLKLFAKCIENISDAVIIYDRQFTTVDVNKSYQKITGKNRQSMLGTSMKFSKYSESFNQNVKKHLITKGTWHGEVESLRANGEQYLTDLNIDVIRDENNNISHFVGVFSDITQRKKTEAELRKLANSDTLTGLPNRSFFQAHQAKLVSNKTPHALMVFDLDNFKKINDSMGHEVGDVLLCKVAERILHVGRKQDSVYRLGGDEFSIIVEDTNDIHTITSIAKDILKTIAQPLKLKNQELVLYSSIGIVLFPEDGSTPQELLKNADTAMYHAKDQGGNKYQFFSESMNKQAVKRLQIENLIRHGLKEDYFSVFYQPKIEISTGKISGMEALVRFETPTKGIISPGVFIPVSEETGQIIDIGEVVLRKACIATKKWVDAGFFKGRIAVNLSAVQFSQPNLVKVISDVLEETGLSAQNLELEITEGTVMDSPQEAIDTMLQIRAMGINLSLDDFGTGYSSLAYLKKFPLNTLKIDKAFVDDIEISDQGRNMVATIVTIAHNLGLNVVAEGVETEPQLSFLTGLRCEQMQGYLYSKPLAEKDFQNYLLSHRITDSSTKFTS